MNKGIIAWLIMLAAFIVFVLGAAVCPGKAELENSHFMELAALALMSLAFVVSWAPIDG